MRLDVQQVVRFNTRLVDRSGAPFIIRPAALTSTAQQLERAHRFVREGCVHPVATLQHRQPGRCELQGPRPRTGLQMLSKVVVEEQDAMDPLGR